MNLFCVIIVSIFIITISGSQSYRLPSTIIPLEYDLTLFPHLSELSPFTFDGWVTIKINISRQHMIHNTSSNFNLQLNKGIDLTINQTEITLSLNISNDDINTIQPEILSLNINNLTEITTFYFNVTNSKLLSLMNESSTEYIVGYFYCSFSSPLIENAQRGFYRSSYEYNGTMIHGTGTQMEPTYTRRALPLFDEPQWRSIFYVTYIAPIDSVTLGNMDIDQVINLTDTTQYQCHYISSKGENDLCKMVKFLPTPAMPAYLLAFVIGDYDYLEYTEINKELIPSGDIINFTQSVWFRKTTTPEYYQFALNNSLTLLHWFEDKFALTYNLNKLDSVAVVQYSGGMENWGLIIYGPASLLLDPNNNNNLRSKIGLYGHELAHQWFGNDVTLEWWDHLWVQEGHARYFEYVAGNETRPDLPFISTYYSAVWEGAFRNSESIFTFPAVRENVATQQEILSQFSQALTYSKGACIAKFMREYIDNDDMYYQGLNTFFITYYYGVYTTDRFLGIFDPIIDEIDKDYNTEPLIATKMFGSYVKQAGFPVLFVEFDEIKSDTIMVKLRQQRMVLEGPTFYSDTNENPYYDPSLPEQFEQQLWYIPFRIEVADGNVLKDFPTNQSERHFEIDRVNDDGLEYYLFNPNADSFFRVVYDETSFNFIINSFDKLSYLSQYGILSDQWRLMRSNYVSAPLYLQLMEKIADPDIITEEYWNFFWNTIVDSLVAIDELLCEYDIISPENNTLSEYRNNFRTFMRNTLDKIWIYLGEDWIINEDTMSSNMINLKRKLLTTFIRINDKDVIDLGVQILLNSSYQNLSAFNGMIPDIDSNIMQQVFQAAFASLNDTVYDIMINTIFPSSSQQNTILNSIGYLYGDEELVQKAYSFINNLTNNGQKNTGYRNLRLCSSRSIVWNNMMMNNAADWLNYYSFNEGNAKSLPDTFASINRYDQVYEFYVSQNILNDSTIDINQTLERMRMNSQWLLKNQDEMIKFLDEYVNDGSDESNDEWLSIVIYVIMGFVVTVIFVVIIFCYITRKKKRKAVRGIKYNIKYDEMNDDIKEMENNDYGSTAT